MAEVVCKSEIFNLKFLRLCELCALCGQIKISFVAKNENKKTKI